MKNKKQVILTEPTLEDCNGIIQYQARLAAYEKQEEEIRASIVKDRFDAAAEKARLHFRRDFPDLIRLLEFDGFYCGFLIKLLSDIQEVYSLQIIKGNITYHGLHDGIYYGWNLDKRWHLYTDSGILTEVEVCKLIGERLG